MANVMSMKNLRNKVTRDGFDLSFSNKFTAKVGQLLPVCVKECFPGDHFRIKADWFTRTQPLNTAAYCKLKEYVDFYFVPNHLLWSLFPDWITQMNDAQFASSNTSKQNLTDQGPYLSSSLIYLWLKNGRKNNAWVDTLSSTIYTYRDMFGFNRAANSARLLQMLGYGDFYPSSRAIDPENIPSFRLSPWRLLAYQKICQDYYRPQQWVGSQPWRFNVNYLSSSSTSVPIPSASNGLNLLDMNYSLYKKDYFTGVLPNAQYGSESVAVIGSESQLELTNDSAFDSAAGSTNLLTVGDSSNAGLSVLAIRKAEALQKWKEISQTGDKSYRDQMSKHFGADVRGVSDHTCTYIGGSGSQLSISPVVNNNLSTDADVTNIKGIGTSGSNSDAFIDYNCREHGIIMGIYTCVPDVDYLNVMIEKNNMKINASDYAIPEFDRIGMQTTSIDELFGLSTATSNTDSFTLGYAPRFAEYKTSVDVINGAFLDTLKNYVVPKNSNLDNFVSVGTDNVINVIPSLYVSPSVVDSVFSVKAGVTTATDCLLIDASFDIKAVRPFDYDGLPY